jgi:hypothetical protein
VNLERPAWEEAVTRADEDEAVQAVLGRYGHRVGETMAADDTCLGRLLATLKHDPEDREVCD